MAKKSFDYFDSFCRQADYLQQAIAVIDKVVDDYNEETLKECLALMRDVETSADGVNAKIRKHLYSDLLTPVDRMDILRLSLALDDTVDNAETILRTFYLYHVPEMDDDIRRELTYLRDGAAALSSALRLLPRYLKKQNKILNYIKIMRVAEDACDIDYVESVHNLYDPEQGCIPPRVQGKVATHQAFREEMTSVELCGTRIDELMMNNS